MIFKEIDNMKNVGAICHYFVRIKPGSCKLSRISSGLASLIIRANIDDVKPMSCGSKHIFQKKRWNGLQVAHTALSWISPYTPVPWPWQRRHLLLRHDEDT